MKIKNRTAIERRWLMMRNEAQSWVPGWKDLQRYIKPTRGFFYDSIPNWGRSIDHKTQLDGAPSRAARILASGMTSGLTSPSRPWFKLGLEDHDLMQMEPIKVWLDHVQQTMMTVFSKSNIYGVLHSIYEEIGTFGSAATLILEDYDTVIRARNFTIGEYYLGQSASGRVDSFGRLYNMTVGQLVEEFGKENVTPQVRNSYERGIVDPWIKIAHLIEPNNDRIPDKQDFENMTYRSVQWELGSPTDLCLRTAGYEEFPVLAPRWNTTTTAHIYGWGPGHEALGDVKMLMKMQKEKLVALDKVIDPPVQMDGAIQGEANLLPGGVTRFSSMTPNGGVRAAYQINPDIPAIEAAIARTTQAIESTYYSDLFLMLAQIDAGKMTATEVAERHEEKLLMLGPVLERLESELLNPLIERTFSIMSRTGVIAPPPPELQGQEIKVEYISMLAQAQKMVGTVAIEQVVTFISNMAAANPDALDNLDVDETIHQYADLMGIPPKIIRSADVVAAVRDAKAKAQQAAAVAQNAPGLIDGAKKLSETKLGQNSALDALTGTPSAAQPVAA